MSSAIDPHSVYTRDEIREIIGDSALRRLNDLGLRAIGRRYLGCEVLDTFRAAHHDARISQRALGERKGGEKTHAQNTSSHQVGADNERSCDRNDTVPKPKRSKALRGQIGEIRGA